MPVELEKKIVKEARKKGLEGKKKNAYVYGALRKTGWTPKQNHGKSSTPLRGRRKM